MCNPVLVFSGVHVPRSLAFCVMFCRSFVLFLLVIVLSVPLRFRPKLKISLFPLVPTGPVKIGRLKKKLLEICNHSFSFFSFRSKFVLLKIPYFRFVSPKDRNFRTSLSLKNKKKPTYLPTSKIVGRVRGNRNIFNCGLIWILITPFSNSSCID